jgi:hypothetical protein
MARRKEGEQPAPVAPYRWRPRRPSLDYKYVYLDFLDKEMTIMGILSAFCVAVVALFLKQIGAKDDLFFHEVFCHGYWYAISGSILVILAAGIFFIQRAEIAGCYGKISKALDFAQRQDAEVYIKEADYWSTWVWYFIGLKSLYAGLVFYGFALVSKYLSFQLWIVGVTIAVFMVWGAFDVTACRTNRESDKPFTDLFRRMLGMTSSS